MKTGNKIVSLLLACSMLAASFAGTTAFAASDKPTPVEGEIETGAVMGYSHSGMDTSYMLDAAAKPRMLSRAARSAQEELPAAYNTIDAGRVTTQVRDQAGWGTCWAFAATGSIASSLYDELQENTPVLSPAHLAYFAFHGKANPEDPADKTDGDTYLPYEYDESMINDDYREYVGGGNTFCSTATFTRGVGPALEEVAPYPDPFYEVDKTPWLDLDPSIQFEQAYRLDDSIYLPTKNADGELDTTAIKKALMENGGSLVVAYDSSGTRAFYYEEEYQPAMIGDDGNGNKVIMTHYTGSDFGDCNHAVQIVGWDDNIPKEYFQDAQGNSPEHDGGWLIRNSWGDWSYMHGYFYMSYDEGTITEVSQYQVGDADEFDHTYQYDGTGWSMSAGAEDKATAVPMANIFTATSDETLRAVSFYTTDANAEYSIQVYTDTNNYNPTSGNKAYEEPQTGTEQYPGYHTVYLDEPVNLKEGENYAVVVTMQNPLGRAYPVACEMNATLDNFRVQAAIDNHQSFISIDGGKSWIDLADVGENYTAHSKRVDPNSQNQEDWTGNIEPGTSGVNIEVAGDFDGDVWDNLANVCLKAFTTEGNDEDAVTPAEAKLLTITYDPTVTMQVSGAADDVVNTAGTYIGKVVSGEELTLSFAPVVPGREITGVTVNGEAVEDFDKNLFTYSLTMGEENMAVDIEFSVVNKITLNAALQLAKEAQKSDEYEAALSDVQEALDKAIANGEEVAASTTATQEEIDDAWNLLFDAVQALQFQNGNMAGLQAVLDLANSLQKEDFTQASWDAMVAVRDEAQAMVDAQDSLQQDIDEMTQALADALNALEPATALDQLQALVDTANGYAADDYIQNDAWDTFEAALEKAEALLASTDPSQEDVTAMIVELSTAMAEIRLVPDKSKLEDLIAKTEGSTDATVKALRTQAIALLANDLATQEEVDALVEELEVAIENAGKPSGGNSSSGNKGSSSSNTSGGNVYAGEGTAVVTSSASVVTAAKSVVSDTTAPFVLKRGSAYCFKMTVVNGSTATPSFTVGNGSVLKTQYVAKVGNDYYFRVYAIGTPGQSTGVYTQMPGEAPVLQCAVTIG